MCLAVPGKIIRVSGDVEIERRALVDFEGIRKEISLAFEPEAQVGEYVLVHVGCAIARIDHREAVRIFEVLQELGELEDLGEEEL